MVYYVNQSNDPYFNQAFEESLFLNAPEDDILLLWRNSPAVVCGCYQNPFAEVSVPAALEKNVAVVRRETGGGTVYHDPGNVNYTRIARAEGQGADYGRFIRPVVEALNRLGIPAAFTRTCDISIQGLKVSGSAQKIAGGRVLHHGTLLYDTDLTALRALANGRQAHYEAKGIRSAPWPVTNIRSHLADSTMDTAQFQQALFCELTRGGAEPRALTAAQLDEVGRLAEEKLRSWEWTYGRTPAFSYRREFLWRGQQVCAEYEAKNAVIGSVRLTPEEGKLAALEKSLAGLALRPELLRAVCETAGCPGLWTFLI